MLSWATWPTAVDHEFVHGEIQDSSEPPACLVCGEHSWQVTYRLLAPSVTDTPAQDDEHQGAEEGKAAQHENNPPTR